MPKTNIEQLKENWRRILIEEEPGILGRMSDVLFFSMIDQAVTLAEAQAVKARNEELVEILESKKGDDDAYPKWNDTLDEIINLVSSKSDETK